MEHEKLLYIVRNAAGKVINACVVETKYSFMSQDLINSCELGDTIEIALPRPTKAEREAAEAERSDKIIDALGLKVVE